MVAVTILSCDNEDAITYSGRDVSSRVTGFSSSKTGPGAELTINGSQLQNVQRVFLGDEVITPANFISHTESEITFTVPTSVPPNAENEKTRVLLVFNGSARAIKEIEVVPFQAISSFAPYSAAEGETVTLIGVNFDLVTSVKVGTSDATIISQSPTVLKFSMPSGAATAKILLESEAGVSSSSSELISCSANPLGLDCASGLNLNTSFEDGADNDFTGWAKQNGGQFMFATTVPGEVFRGNRAIKVVRDGTLSSGEWRLQLHTNFVDTEIGASYTVTLWARATVAGAGIRLSLSPDTGLYTATAPVTTEWQLFTFEVPGERIQNAQTKFSLDMNANNTVATTFFIDDFKVMKN